ncbi:MAG: sodium:solute symporter family protein, partial [Amoebophilaceae bacterium]|nr:sodium:solute symporter family protein [Amoebophilaceae bacterium]
MHYLTIDHLIVYASLLLTLIVGLRAGRGIKTIREYAVGNKMFGTASLVFTYMATNLAGSVMFSNGGLVFSDGIIVTCSFFGFCVAEIMVGIFIAPKATYFGDCFTMGDLIQKFYGRYAGIIAGLLGLIQATLIAGMELIAIGLVCESLLGIKAEWGIIIGGFILAIYSAHGGIKAVVATDILQFFTLMAVIPIAAEVALHRVGGMQALFNQLPPEKLAIFSHEKFSYYLVCFLVWGVFPSSVIDPAIIQRMLMATNPIKLRRQYFITALLNPITHIITMLIALAGFVLYPTMDANNTIPYTLSKILPMGIKGCTAAGLIALIMSTVDSCLHVAGLTLIHDVVRPLCNKSLTSHTEKRFAQMSTVIIGIITIAIGLHTTDIFGLFLGVLETTGPILMFPLLTGIMGLKPEKNAFYMAMCTTILVWVGCKCFLPEAYDYLSLLITIVTNGVTFLGTHLYINKRFKTVQRHKEQYLNTFTPSRPFFQDLLPKNLLVYVQQQLKGYNPPYVLAGIFCLFNLIVPHFLLNQFIKAHTKYLLVAHVLGGVLSVLLMAKEKWTPFFQAKYLPALFYWTLLYCLPFTSTLMFILSGGDSNWLAHLLLSLTCLLVLVDWGMALLLTILGLGLTFLVYPHFGPIDWEWHTTSGNLRMYQLLFALLVSIFFARRKQRQIHQLVQEKQQLCQCHALRETDYLHHLQYQALEKKHLEIQKEPLRLAKEALVNVVQHHPSDAPLAQKGLEQLDSFLTYYKSSFYQTMDALRLHISTIPLTDLLVQLNSHINGAEHS